MTNATAKTTTKLLRLLLLLSLPLLLPLALTRPQGNNLKSQTKLIDVSWQPVGRTLEKERAKTSSKWAHINTHTHTLMTLS